MSELFGRAKAGGDFSADEKRVAEYPDLETMLDALIAAALGGPKVDLQEIKNQRDAVKAKYPKA